MELKDIIEAGLKAQGEKLELAIKKFEGQLQEKGNIDTEVKGEVKTLAEQFKKLSGELNELAQKHAKLPEGVKATESVSEQFVKSDAYKAVIEGKANSGRIEVKNTVLSGTGTTFPTQMPGVIPGSFAPLTIRNAIISVPVNSNSVQSLRELTWTNNAAETAQAAAKPESVLIFEQYDVPIQTVAHFIKISKQLMEDAPAITAYIDTRLRDGLGQKIDAQLIIGNGTSPQLSGLTDSGNFVAYTPVAGDLLIDAINRAKYAMWATGNMPDSVIVNPADWGAMERARESAGAGLYLYGMAGTTAGMNPFGLQIVISNHVTAGSFIVAALRSSAMIYNRNAAVIEMGYVNDDFTKNLITIRAEERLGLGVERPAGIRYGLFTPAA